MGTMMEKEVLIDMARKGVKHLVNMKWFDVPILGTMRKDDLGLNLMGIDQIIAVMPKLIVVTSLAIEFLFNLL